MRLKISPKSAILKIDFLIKEGADFLDFISEDYWLQEEQEKELAQVRKENQEKEFEQKLEKAAPEQKAALKMMKIFASDNVSFGNKSGVPDKTLASYETKYNAWLRKSTDALKDIFEDFTPIYLFSHTEIAPNTNQAFPTDHNFEKFACIKKYLKSEMAVLVNFYNQLQENIKSPLIYLPEKAQIWFYDFMCQLTPDTNEAEVCRFLFQFGIGQWQEISDIYVFLKGEKLNNKKDWDKNWQKTVNNAYDSINGKTNGVFGFPILKKEKSLMALSLPSRFISKIE